MNSHDKDQFLNGFATRLVHAGEQSNPLGAVVTPLFETASFSVESMERYHEIEEMLSSVATYSRGYNPTVRALEVKLASLEGAADALAFSSGMAAISTTLLALLRGGGHLIASKYIFTTSQLLLSEDLPGTGCEVTHVDVTDVSAIHAAIRPNTRAIFLEVFTNPGLRVVDLPAVAQLAQKAGIALVVDNTFLSPYLLRPLEHGADFVVHSTTKYIAGHGRVLGGVVAGSARRLEPVAELRRRMGTIATPHNASVMLDGSKTLAVRLDRQCETAQHLAEVAARHPAVANVYYPGLEHHPDGATARRLVGRRFGGVFSFSLHDMGRTKAPVFDAFELIIRATSLGDVATLVDSFDDPDVLRIAVGLEDAADLTADLTQALDAGLAAQQAVG